MENESADKLNTLGFLVGKWKTTGEILDTDPAVIIAGTDSYEWILDGKFILHKADVMMGDEKIEVIELIGGFDPLAQSVQMHSFDTQGNIAIMNGIMEKGVLKISGDNMRAELSASNENKMIAHWEKRENGSWKAWMKLAFSK